MTKSLPETMRQIRFTAAGGPEVIAVETVPLPEPAAGQVLIEVVAAGVNRPDIMQRQGSYPPPKGATEIPGLEIAGRIAALGEGVTGFSEGEEVCALVAEAGAHARHTEVMGGGTKRAIGAMDRVDQVITTQRLDRIVDAIAIGRRSLRIAQQSVVAGLALSFGAIACACASVSSIRRKPSRTRANSQPSASQPQASRGAGAGSLGHSR